MASAISFGSVMTLPLLLINGPISGNVFTNFVAYVTIVRKKYPISLGQVTKELEKNKKNKNIHIKCYKIALGYLSPKTLLTRVVVEVFVTVIQIL